MAAKAKSTPKNTSERRERKALTEAQRVQKNRIWSIVLSIIGVFLIFVTWLKDDAVLWQGMQGIMWGLFGVAAALVPPIVVYVAIMLALDKSKSALITKIIQGIVLILLVCPLAEVIYSLANGLGAFSGEEFTKILNSLYENGAVNHQGGGALSIILGYPLSFIGDVPALAVLSLLVILFVMLLTNITFVDVWRFFVKLGKKIKTAWSESSKEATLERIKREEEQKRIEAEKAKAEKNKEKRIDVAKFIRDDADTPSADDKPIFTDFSGNGKDKPKKEEKKRKKTPADFIPDDNPNAENEEAGIVNPIYVDEEGQTTLIEVPDATQSTYALPSVDLLNPSVRSSSEEDTRAEAEQNSETLVETLRSFGVATRIVEIHRGPSVTRYELQPAAGVKVSKITNLANDIALNLAASGVRIEAPIPGKAAVGIELANKVRETVCIRELIDTEEFRSAPGKLCFPVGKDIEGKIVFGDISKMPHLLIAGTTGSGKSVFTNSIIMSILYNASPDEVKLILVDPKQVEFPIYNGIPHLLIPVVTEAKKAAGALGWAVVEMLKRYKMFADNSVRDIKDYNKLAAEKEELKPLPQIVIIVDELADLMMAAPKEVEDYICRLAQLARAAGMHLVIATQSPRVSIVTGLIKANIPSRVALKVSNQIDSSVILDEGGAEKLLGNGDMLYKPVGLGKPLRVQGSFVTTQEIKRVVDFLKAQSSVQYDEEVASEIEKHIPVAKGEKPEASSSSESSVGADDMTERAIEAVIEAGQASTSYLQRKLKLGYARAARIMDELEEMGIVGPADGSKPREVRITQSQWLERRANLGAPDYNTDGEF
ncbi:MAG: DNA translocase FtsK [Oscillospiraceae bacterium]|nr:DNA translocase FtsK [Oscillospiraceae bacterium]